MRFCKGLDPSITVRAIQVFSMAYRKERTGRSEQIPIDLLPVFGVLLSVAEIAVKLGAFVLRPFLLVPVRTVTMAAPEEDGRPTSVGIISRVVEEYWVLAFSLFYR